MKNHAQNEKTTVRLQNAEYLLLRSRCAWMHSLDSEICANLHSNVRRYGIFREIQMPYLFREVLLLSQLKDATVRELKE